MIIYGSRMYGRKNRIVSQGRCVHCGKIGTQTSYDGRKWGHLYFIPLIPSGGHVRVLRECASCRVGSHIPVEKLPGIIESLQKTLDQAVVALGAKESKMELGGKAQSVASVIGSHIGDVYCLIGEKEVAQLLQNLKAVDASEELLLAEAKIAELSGRTGQAAAKFGELSERSQDPLVLYQIARFFFEQARLGEATALAERLETRFVADLEVKQLLIDCYLAGKHWAKVATTYESCFLIAPGLRNEKSILKAYQKACKKAGREPQKQG
jgi:hypothetical protein